MNHEVHEEYEEKRRECYPFKKLLYEHYFSVIPA